MRVKITRSEVHKGAVWLKDSEHDLPVETAEALITAQIAIALDQDEIPFEIVSPETIEE